MHLLRLVYRDKERELLLFLANLWFFLSVNPVDEILTGGVSSGFTPTLSIGIYVKVSSIEIESDASVTAQDGTVLPAIQGRYRYSATGDFIVQNGKRLKTTEVTVTPKLGFSRLNGHFFRGIIKIVAKKGRITVVNILPIEEYVRGVINREALPNWPLEAKKAQAVLARTFAVYQKIYHPRSPLYDLAPSVLDQVYGGLERENVSSNRAVKETKGEVLTINNMPLKIYFHSTCGGRTASAKEVWGKNVSYLKSVKCPYCSRSPLYRWTRIYRSSLIEKRLKKAGYATGRIRSVSVIRGKTRVKAVKINKTIIPVNAFRAAVGYTAIWSNNFTVSLRHHKITFRGKGAGHGVSVCQYGMAGMAKLGKKYDEILKFYLKGVTLRRMY